MNKTKYILLIISWMVLTSSGGVEARYGFFEYSLVVAEVLNGSGSVINREFVIRVVDEADHPIKHAEVTGWTKFLDKQKNEDHKIPFKGLTDSGGMFRYRTTTQIYLKIQFPGYYPWEKFWVLGEIPTSTLVVKLQRMDRKVVLFSNELRMKWRSQKEISFGIKFVDGRNLSFEAKNRLGLTDKKEASDLWFEIQTISKSEQDSFSQTLWSWSIQILGRNGWEVAPGPMEDNVVMRTAPNTGYGSMLKYNIAICPRGFYLRWKGGKRYGKLYGLWFEDYSRRSPGGQLSLLQEMGLHYAVQEEDVGIGSLNPFTPQEEEKYLADRLAAQRPEDTQMRRAAMMGETAKVAALLKQGAKIDSVNQEDKTALILAAENGHAGTVLFLIENGADMNLQKRSSEGQQYAGTALMLAAENGHLEVVRVLVENGARLEEEDCIGRTALLWAVGRGQGAIVRYFLLKGSDANHIDDAGHTALMRASTLCDSEIVKELVGAHAEINVVSTELNLGLTALIIASLNGCADIVQILVEKGADVNIRSKWGTALKVAREKKHEAIVKILLAAGATE